MVRARKKSSPADDAASTADFRAGLDVNAVVSYNLKAIRERHGWTQQAVAERLAALTGHTLPQASISAMERGFDGERRRRFDAQELYLLSVVFDVPVVYFFLPPPGTGSGELADTGRPVIELYAAVLGQDWQLAPVDERLAEIGLQNPDEADQALVAIFGARGATGGWHDHFRTWRQKRLHQVERQYGDRLDEVADFLVEFAGKIKAVGPKTYLQSLSQPEAEEE